MAEARRRKMVHDQLCRAETAMSVLVASMRRALSAPARHREVLASQGELPGVEISSG